MTHITCMSRRYEIWRFLEQSSCHARPVVPMMRTSLSCWQHVHQAANPRAASLSASGLHVPSLKGTFYTCIDLLQVLVRWLCISCRLKKFSEAAAMRRQPSSRICWDQFAPEPRQCQVPQLPWLHNKSHHPGKTVLVGGLTRQCRVATSHAAAAVHRCQPRFH